MSRAISRDSFDELKNYLGVFMQQGRVMLDADWNENQDVNLSFLRRLTRELQGDGTPNHGFAIHPSLPGVLSGLTGADDLPPMSSAVPGHPLFFFLNLPGESFERFESLADFSLTAPDGSPAKGRLRLVEHGRPYEGRGFLRLSGHTGTVRVMKKVRPEDRQRFASHEIATFRFRVNAPQRGTLKFIVRDETGNETRWRNRNTAFASDLWLPGFANPLDTRFNILTSGLPPAARPRRYGHHLSVFGGETPIKLDESPSLPDDLGMEQPNGRAILIGGRAGVVGTFPFTVRLTDAKGVKTSRDFTIDVLAAGDDSREDETPIDLTPFFETSGTPADLTKIVAFGFELLQNGEGSLVWDLDDLRLGNGSQQARAAENDFVIRGSRLPTVLSLKAIENAYALASNDKIFDETVDLVRSLTQSGEVTAENAGRFYVAGLPCLQFRDVLYSEQADPNDPPLAPPAAGPPRQDAVYLDVWTEPVTYVEDPDLREVALGGLDTTTRTVVRHRVRVAQGAAMPKGNGLGGGRLSTDGTYTGLANRLYRVEVDTPGAIGAATFRWSDDNASTIQRVIEPIPRGSKVVIVEDASAFQPNDSILIRKAFGFEEHVVSALIGNRIVLQNATGAQLLATPAGQRDPAFADFTLEDRPRIERWNAFRVQIVSDPDDRGFSRTIDLNDGVQVRFSGTNLVLDDYWIFKARQLAAGTPGGSGVDRRIERLDCARPRGVVHHFTPLAVLTRVPTPGDRARLVQIVGDQRRATEAATITTGDITGVDVAVGLPANTRFPLALLEVSGGTAGSSLVVRLSGVAPMNGAPPGELTFIFCSSRRRPPDRKSSIASTGSSS